MLATGITAPDFSLPDQNGIIHTLDEFRGKKYVACGDSFTEGDFTGLADAAGNTGIANTDVYDREWGCYKTYPYWIAKKNAMELVNEAICGTTMTYDSIWGRNAFSNRRYRDIPADADYITIYLGINDSHKKAEIGTIDDTVNTTFLGAWNIVLEYLITNHPYAKIGVIISNGCDTSAYPDATRAAARKWGIPYLDLEEDYQVPLMHRVRGRDEVCERAKALRMRQFRVSSTNTHPNLQAHIYESTFIENFLRSL